MSRVIAFLVLTTLANHVVHATQDAAHYALPSNIYDNIPSGLTTPASFRTYPVATPTFSISEHETPSPSAIDAPSAIMGPTGFDITTPVLNSVYTPGSALMMTWSNHEVTFPDSWTPPQSILDMITASHEFSHSPLLTPDDMRNLAKMKIQGLRAARQMEVIKDSPIWLKSLRLVSWPLVDETAAENSMIKNEAITTILSPKILSDPGFNLLLPLSTNSDGNSTINSARLTFLERSGGALLWTIPADWAYEGEFEIQIPSDSTTSGQHTSRSFWILRDSITRQLNPQYNLPSMDKQQQTLLGISGDNGFQKTRAETQRQKDIGVFLGVAAMMVAFVLVGLGVVVGMYRRKWAAQAAAAESASVDDRNNSGSTSDSAGRSLPNSHRGSASSLGSVASTACSSGSARNENSINRMSFLRNQYSEYTSSSMGLLSKRQNLLDPVQGDEDAQSPKDLNLSDETLQDIVLAKDEKVMEKSEKDSVDTDEAAAIGSRRRESVTPVDESFVDLPLYETFDTAK
ncbi:hypothetical protein FBU30_005249 [Linnemannia zychae]|nr:hypothetical protein FBU30_005249 [Linnemannia zychae]